MSVRSRLQISVTLLLGTSLALFPSMSAQAHPMQAPAPTPTAHAAARPQGPTRGDRPPTGPAQVEDAGLKSEPADALSGEQVAISGTLSTRFPRTVMLERLTATDSWATEAASRSGDDGSVSIGTTLVEATTYRLSAPAVEWNKAWYPSITTSSLDVAPAAQTVSLALPSAASVHTSLAAQVTTTPVRLGRRVVLEHRAGADEPWTIAARGTEDASGRSAFPISTDQLDITDYRARVERVGRTPSADSDPVTLTISDAPPPAPPVITGVSPTSGSIFGGEIITLTGTDLAAVTSVQIGATAVSSFTASSATSISFVAPAGAAGAAPVSATSPLGTSPAGAQATFTYMAPAPQTDVQYVPAATTTDLSTQTMSAYVPPMSTATSPSGSAADPAYVTLPQPTVAPTVGSFVFVAPGSSGTVPDGLSSQVVSVDRNLDGSNTIGLIAAPLDKTLASHDVDIAGPVVMPSQGDAAPALARGSAVTVPAPAAHAGSSRIVPAGAIRATTTGSTAGPDPGTSLLTDDSAAFKCSGGSLTQFHVQLSVADVQVELQDLTDGSGVRHLRSAVSADLTLSASGATDGPVTCELDPSWAKVAALANIIGPGGIRVGFAPTLTFELQGAFSFTQSEQRIVGFTKDGDAAPVKIDQSIPLSTTPAKGLEGLTVAMTVGVQASLTWVVVKLTAEAGVEVRFAVAANSAGVLCLATTISFVGSISAGLDLVVHDWTFATLSFDYTPVWGTASVCPVGAPDLALAADPTLPSDASSPRDGTWEQLNGTLSADTKLSADHSGYIVGPLTVPAGVTLTVPAGVRLRFLPCGYWGSLQPCVNVQGSVDIQGTTDAPVLLSTVDDTAVGGPTGAETASSPTGGEWSGFNVGDGGSLAVLGAVVRYSGAFLDEPGATGSTLIADTDFVKGASTSLVSESGTTLDLSRVSLSGGGSITARGSFGANGVAFTHTHVDASGSDTRVANSRFADSSELSVASPSAVVTTVDLDASSLPIQADSPAAAGASFLDVTSTDGNPWIQVAGTKVNGPTTWSTRLPLVPESPLVVPVDASLTLTAGVTVKFPTCIQYSGTSVSPCISVAGSLQVSGESTQPVQLASRDDAAIGGATPPTAADTSWGSGTWNGIRASGTAHIDLTYVTAQDAAYFVRLTDTSSLDAHHITVANTSSTDGYWTGAIDVGPTNSAVIDSATFTNTSPFAVTSEGAATVTNSLFADTSLYVASPQSVATGDEFSGPAAHLRVTPEGAGATLSPHFTGGSEAQIDVASGSSGAITTGSYTWSSTTPYVIGDFASAAPPIRLDANTSITLAAGATVKLGSCGEYWSGGILSGCFNIRGGRFTAAGTASTPVVLTSLDDSTNGTGPEGATPPRPWKGIDAETGASVNLQHVRALYAGTLLTADGTDVTLDHLSASDGGTLARIADSSTLKATAVTVDNMNAATVGSGVIDVESSSVGTIDTSSFTAAVPNAVAVGSGVAVTNSTFTNSAVYVRSSAATVTGDQFSGATAALRTTPEGAAATLSPSFSGGALSQITVLSSPDVTPGAYTWSSSTPYVVGGSQAQPVRLGTGVAITVAAGVVLKFDRCTYSYWNAGSTDPCFDVRGGTLDLEGTAADPVTLTSAGDTSDGTSPATDPTPALPWGWSGISASGSSTITLRHVNVLYAALLLTATDEAAVTIDGLTHSNDEGTSIYQNSSTTPAVITNSAGLG